MLLLTVPGTEESESDADKDTQWDNKKVKERTCSLVESVLAHHFRALKIYIYLTECTFPLE